MEDLRKFREQVNRQPNVSEWAEYKQLVNRFNKDEEQKNMKNLLFGTAPFFQLKKDEEK